jgi:hypothetical protein
LYRIAYLNAVLMWAAASRTLTSICMCGGGCIYLSQAAAAAAAATLTMPQMGGDQIF